jgi:hypothetical protein
LHLLAAIAFIGTVFFEVIILGGAHRYLSRETRREVEHAVGLRARTVIPWVLLVLYGAGFGMAWQHRAALAVPTGSSFGLLLSIKILLAISVFGHFLFVMVLSRRQRLDARRSRRIHLSVFVHVVTIALLAKAMFYVTW